MNRIPTSCSSTHTLLSAGRAWWGRSVSLNARLRQHPTPTGSSCPVVTHLRLNHEMTQACPPGTIAWPSRTGQWQCINIDLFPKLHCRPSLTESQSPRQRSARPPGAGTPLHGEALGHKMVCWGFITQGNWRIEELLLFTFCCRWSAGHDVLATLQNHFIWIVSLSSFYFVLSLMAEVRGR